MDLLKTDVKKLYRSYLVPSLSAAVVTSVYSFVDMIAIGQGVGRMEKANAYFSASLLLTIIFTLLVWVAF